VDNFDKPASKMSDKEEEDSKDKSKRPLEVSSEGNDEVEEKRSSRKRGKNLKIFLLYFAFQAMIGQLLIIIPSLTSLYESR
jgi:hypothetical protein